MQIRFVSLGLVVASLALLALSGCGGGGGGGGGIGGGNTATVGINVSGAQWVAFQDGKDGTWQTLSSSGGVSRNVAVTASDGRYSVAWVCPGEKAIVNVVHATRSEMPDLNATCPSAPSGETVNVTVQVQGLSAGAQSLTGIERRLFVGSGQTQPVVKGVYDVISTRFGAGGVANKVWIERSVPFNNDRTYSVNFDQPDGTLIRVVDVSSGTLTITGIDTSAGESVLALLELVSANRSSLIAGDTTFGNPLSYPIIPSGILTSGERFRVRLRSSRERGEERVLAALPPTLEITLPQPFNPDFGLNSSGPVAVSAIVPNYAETPVRGYQMTIGGSGQTARWNILISAGWLGNDMNYTSPGAIQTLEGWNSSWSIQPSVPVDVSMTVAVSQNSPREVLDFALERPVPVGFTVRFATRSLTLNP